MKTTAQSGITLFIDTEDVPWSSRGSFPCFFPKPGRYPKLFLTFPSAVKGWNA